MLSKKKAYFKAIVADEGKIRFQIQNMDSRQLLKIASQILETVQAHVGRTSNEQASLVAEVNMPLRMLIQHIEAPSKDTTDARHIQIEIRDDTEGSSKTRN